jgi:hypothetical protein
VYPDRAFRPDSCTLCIITDPGDTLVFRDQRDTDYIEDFAVYELLSFLPEQDCWVISKVCYEWAITLLVDGSDGSTTEAVSHPEPSPDGTRLLCANVDIMAGFLDNGIQVWRMDRDSLVLEFQDLSVPWGPDEARWAGDSLIVFQKRTYDWELEEFSSRPGWLELSGDGTWVPDDPADWEL